MRLKGIVAGPCRTHARHTEAELLRGTRKNNEQGSPGRWGPDRLVLRTRQRHERTAALRCHADPDGDRAMGGEAPPDLGSARACSAVASCGQGNAASAFAGPVGRPFGGAGLPALISSLASAGAGPPALATTTAPSPIPGAAGAWGARSMASISLKRLM